MPSEHGPDTPHQILSVIHKPALQGNAAKEWQERVGLMLPGWDMLPTTSPDVGFYREGSHSRIDFRKDGT